jgi:hypothetical protein
MRVIINCHCGKQLEFLNLCDFYTCPHCKRQYYKMWYIEGGEYKYTFNLIEETIIVGGKNNVKKNT